MKEFLIATIISLVISIVANSAKATGWRPNISNGTYLIDVVISILWTGWAIHLLYTLP